VKQSELVVVDSIGHRLLASDCTTRWFVLPERPYWEGKPLWSDFTHASTSVTVAWRGKTFSSSTR
jgi:hypothetical protein